MFDRRAFLSDIEHVIARHDMTASEFGLKALRDSAFVLRVRRGREPRSVTVKRVYRCIRRLNAKAAGKRGN